MSGLSVSVVVASRGRAEALSLCLTALGQVEYHPLEVVVVADETGCKAARSHALGSWLKIVLCAEANLSAARNLGIGAAAGEVVAFIDDDAFAEPDWIGELVDVFAMPGVMAVGGYVVGRNGISLQWGARSVDPEGWHHDLRAPSDAPWLPEVPAGHAVRTEGTNMAIRREALVALGGFDEAFRYFLDETDFNWRLTKAGMATAIAPRARVWHRQDPSPVRGADRAPRRLFEIGASTAAFLARHGRPAHRADALAAHRDDQKRRLLRHMVAGGLMPGDVPRLLRDFDAGAEAGAAYPVACSENLNHPPPFQGLHDRSRNVPRSVLGGWAWARGRLAREAAERAAGGASVHVLRLTPTALYHRRQYIEPGVWLQTGGLFGRSERSGPLFRWTGLPDRLDHEAVQGPLRKSVPKSTGNW